MLPRTCSIKACTLTVAPRMLTHAGAAGDNCGHNKASGQQTPPQASPGQQARPAPAIPCQNPSSPLIFRAWQNGERQVAAVSKDGGVSLLDPAPASPATPAHTHLGPTPDTSPAHPSHWKLFSSPRPRRSSPSPSLLPWAPPALTTIPSTESPSASPSPTHTPHRLCPQKGPWLAQHSPTLAVGACSAAPTACTPEQAF